MSKKQKLELTWIGKDERPKLEPRILIEDPELSYHADKRYGDNDQFDNILIQGDNLLALKALEQDYAGKVKCIYIDPPYNTGNAFENYQDGLEHSIWLNLFYDRVRLLRELLSKDGVIFIHLDGNESHYAKIICDEIFGRENFIGELVWKKRKGGGNDSQFFATDHDNIMCFVKSKIHQKEKWRVSYDDKYLSRYKEIDRDGQRYYWDTLNRPGLKNPIAVSLKAPDGTSIEIASQKSKETVMQGLEEGHIRIKPTGKGWSVQHRVYMPKEGKVLRSILDDHGSNKDGGDDLRFISNNPKVFDYPKPEQLIKCLIELTTSTGDIVLDSFAGSGTTASVAHQLKRKWIAVEIGNQAETIIASRLKAVINNVQKAAKLEHWIGGGGYRFYRLAPSLLEKDPFGNWVISKDYDPNMLSAAICKVMGFTYAPSDKDYWNHGYSTESDFIFVTTSAMTHDALVALSAEVGPDRSLMVCCKAFSTNAPDSFENLTLKKIPHAVMDKCEWGKDDYSLNVQNLPMFEDENEDDEQDLFDLMDGEDA